ncbi:NusG domain II-containing protein [Enterococcus faecalis]|uniref:NusG domain II-containing protein n=1 Tax=Enterococcus faecalis TaxID=1351 RepID=UPI003DA005FA
MKIGDVIIIGILIISSFTPSIAPSLEKGNQGTTKYAVVRINGKEVDRFNLDKTHKAYVKYHASESLCNRIEIKDGKIRDTKKSFFTPDFFSFSWFSIPAKSSFFSPHKTTPIFGKKGSPVY